MSNDSYNFPHTIESIQLFKKKQNIGKQGPTENTEEINRPILTEKSRETQQTIDSNALIQIQDDLKRGVIKELSDEMETCTSKLEPFFKK